MNGKTILSTVLGGLFGAGVWWVLERTRLKQSFPVALFAALLFSGLLWLALRLYDKALEKKYAEFEKEIHSPVFYQANGNFELGDGRVKNGNLYFCEDGILCVSLEEKPYAVEEIPVSLIHKIRYDNIHFHIHTQDGREFRVTIPHADRIIPLLTERDWVE